MVNNFLKTIEFSKTDVDGLLDLAIPTGTNMNLNKAGICFEFFKNADHTATRSSIDFLRMVATRGYWNNLDGGFVRISHVAEGRVVEMLDQKIPGRVHKDFSAAAPFDYVFFEDDAIRTLSDYDPDGTKGRRGVCLTRVIVTAYTGGSLQKYQGLMAWPYNPEHNPFNAHSMQDEMAYNFGVICPPAWKPA